MLNGIRNDLQMQEYLQENIYSVADHEEFLDKRVGARPLADVPRQGGRPPPDGGASPGGHDHGRVPVKAVPRGRVLRWMRLILPLPGGVFSLRREGPGPRGGPPSAARGPPPRGRAARGRAEQVRAPSPRNARRSTR